MSAYTKTLAVFRGVVEGAAGTNREINDGGIEDGKIFTLDQSMIPGIAENLAQWWTEKWDILPTWTTAEEYLEETYPETDEMV